VDALQHGGGRAIPLKTAIPRKKYCWLKIDILEWMARTSRYRVAMPEKTSCMQRHKSDQPGQQALFQQHAVARTFGLCRSMIYQIEADLRFPQRVKIGVREVVWLENEVRAWLIRRIATSRK
jgi:predicted DNA-binding transcriptional regulator AlpA